MTGKAILSGTSTRVDVQGLTSALYILRINSWKNIVTKK